MRLEGNRSRLTCPESSECLAFLKNENSFTKKHPIDVVWSHIYRRSPRLSDCVQLYIFVREQKIQDPTNRSMM